jgi:hypothetical protein
MRDLNSKGFGCLFFLMMVQPWRGSLAAPTLGQD